MPAIRKSGHVSRKNLKRAACADAAAARSKAAKRSSIPVTAPDTPKTRRIAFLQQEMKTSEAKIEKLRLEIKLSTERQEMLRRSSEGY